MIRCWWVFRPVDRAITAVHRHHVRVGPATRRRIVRRTAAVLVCTVTAAPLGYGIGSRIWEQGYGVVGNGYSGSSGGGSGYGLGEIPGATGTTLADQQSTPVPEPSSLALFAAAMVPLIIIVRALRR